MFSKNKTYLFPSDHHHHHTHSSIVDLNGDQLFIHHHHPDIFFSHHHNNNDIPDHHLQSATNLLLNHQSTDPTTYHRKAQTSQKECHIKIFTSQGPRDRRVRLSISIARKFFNLQEMLDFDKPSKTLDWLFTKSKAAIKELVQTMEKTNKSSFECDELIIPSDPPFEYKEDTSKGKSGSKNIKGGATSSISIAKEVRAKSRSRARERTKENMCIKQQKNGGKNEPCLDPSNPFNIINIPSQYSNKNNITNQLGIFQFSAAGLSTDAGNNHEAMFRQFVANNNHHHKDLI